MNAKKQNSRWKSAARYSETRAMEDEQRGDAVTEVEWVARRKEPKGWRNGAKLK